MGQRQANSFCSLQDAEAHRHVAANADILTKARELGIKIWALEKLQRMMSTMFNAHTGEQPGNGPLTRSHATASLASAKQGKETDLQQLLRHEKLVGTGDMSVAPQDMCNFRGYFIYVHDMDEKTRPVMIRDYAKVAQKEEGKWPQFRLSAAGRCPFVEDPIHTRKLRMQEEERAVAEEKQRENVNAAPCTRSRAAAGLEGPPQQALAERQPNVGRSPRKAFLEGLDSKPLDPPKLIPGKRQNSINSVDSMPPMFGSAQANIRGHARYVGGEPVASGVQPSNITSAIRSQIVSSNAISSTAPGARLSTSKEITALKRKVLERGNSIPSNNTINSSYLNDMRAALNGDGPPATRAAKRKAQETLGYINEEPEGEGTAARGRRVQPPRKKTAVEKELKPGYCENCRDKFDDFDQVSDGFTSPPAGVTDRIKSIFYHASTANSPSQQRTGPISTVFSASSNVLPEPALP